MKLVDNHFFMKDNINKVGDNKKCILFIAKGCKMDLLPSVEKGKGC